MSKILIVDDEPDVVALIQRALEMERFETVVAYDGISALDLIETENPSLVLLDIMMPMMSGYEVCQQIKSNPHTKHIPVLLVTSAHNEMTRKNAQTSGAQGLLIKPFVAAELVAQVQRHLEFGKAKPEAANNE